MFTRWVRRVREPKLFDVIMYEGRYHAVVRIEWPGTVMSLEPVMDYLTRNTIVVGKGTEYLTMREALIMDGWTPPNDSDGTTGN